MFNPSKAISRALENGNEPQEICRRLMEQYLAGDEADKTALASALIVELAARAASDRESLSRVDCPRHTEFQGSTPAESSAVRGARADEMGFADGDRQDGKKGPQRAGNQAEGDRA